MKSIQEVVESVRNAVIAGDWDQAIGTAGFKCCVGAKLALAYQVADHHVDDYINGVDAFAEAVGGNRAHIILMLKQAGAGRNPLGAAPWPLSREEVWDNLAKIEDLPKLPGADLRGANLYEADLSEADLRVANLSKADLQGANLSEAELQGADLRRANLSEADLSKTDLRGADLRGAVID